MSRFSQFLKPAPGLALAGIATFAAGGGVGANVTHAIEPVEAMAPAAPVRVAALANAARPWFGEPVVTVRGRVADIYGDRFLLDDGSGRALVELGRDRGVSPVARNQIVIVQGRFQDGLVRADYLVGPDGRVAALDRHHGPHGGPRDHRGRDEDDRPAPPAPPAQPGA
jgi:hypothetical protein